MEFKPIELSDNNHYSDFLKQTKEIPFPLTTSIIYGNKDTFSLTRAYSQNLCWQKGNFHDVIMQYPPLGDWDNADWKSIFSQMEPSTKFCLVPEYLYHLWMSIFPNNFEVSADIGEWDYIYDLKTLAIDNRNIRRLVTRFKNTYEYTIVPISAENAYIIKDFNKKASELIEEKSDSDFNELEEDNIALNNILDNWDSLKKLDGYFIKVDNNYASYMITEAIDDKRIFALYSKNDYNYDGVGQMVIYQLHEIYSQKGFEYLNYANDTNSEGLRTFKNRLQAKKQMLKNYRLTWKG